MTWQITFTDGPFSVVIETAGVGTVEGFAALREAVLTDTRFRPGMAVLIDHSKLDPSAATVPRIQDLAQGIERLDDAFGGGLTAIVLPSSVLFGLGRMWEAYAGDAVNARIQLVHSVDEAYAWLEAVTLS